MIGCRPWEYDSPISSFPLKMIETAPCEKENKAKVRLSYSCSEIRVSGLHVTKFSSCWVYRIFIKNFDVLFSFCFLSNKPGLMLIASRGDPPALVGSPTGIFFSKVSASLLAESISSLVHVSELRTFH